MLTKTKLADMFEMKISIGSIVILVVQLVGVIVYVMVTLAQLKDVSAKIDTIQVNQNEAKLALAIQARDGVEAMRRVGQVETQLDRLSTHLNIIDSEQASLAAEINSLKDKR